MKKLNRVLAAAFVCGILWLSTIATVNHPQAVWQQFRAPKITATSLGSAKLPQRKTISLESRIDPTTLADLRSPVDTSLSETTEKELAKRIPILMYHSISDNPKNLLCLAPTRFAEQMRYLKQAGYHPLSFRELDDWKQGKPLPKKPILITLDDGYRDNYMAAFPILQAEQMKATIFMTVGFFNGKLNLTEDMAKEMQASGLIEFGSHTLSHMDLTTLPTDRLLQEIVQSKLELEKRLGTAVTAFCYPSGRFNEQTIRVVQQAGYEFAVTTKPGWAELAQSPYGLYRIRINGDMTLEQLQKILP